jgi:hypothetical protein
MPGAVNGASVASSEGLGGDPSAFVDIAAARRVAGAHDVDLDTALEILSLVLNDEKLAGKLLSTVSRGVIAMPAVSSSSLSLAAEVASSLAAAAAVSVDTRTAPVAEGDRTAAAAGSENAAAGYGGDVGAAGAAAVPNPDMSEYYISDDVKVVEDFSDVSDNELAKLINELQRELAENDKK